MLPIYHTFWYPAFGLHAVDPLEWSKAKLVRDMWVPERSGEWSCSRLAQGLSASHLVFPLQATMNGRWSSCSPRRDRLALSFALEKHQEPTWCRAMSVFLTCSVLCSILSCATKSEGCERAAQLLLPPCARCLLRMNALCLKQSWECSSTLEMLGGSPFLFLESFYLCIIASWR